MGNYTITLVVPQFDNFIAQVDGAAYGMLSSWPNVREPFMRSYDFARIHKTLRITPSMAAGLSDHVWSLEEIVPMADAYMPKPAKRGPYKRSARTA